jgi:hypothetical protein
VYAHIAAEVRASYTLGFESTNTRADGRWRRLEVKLARPERRALRVRARQGYYAPLRGR